jgi:hypothetical protein
VKVERRHPVRPRPDGMATRYQVDLKISRFGVPLTLPEMRPVVALSVIQLAIAPLEHSGSSA